MPQVCPMNWSAKRQALTRFWSTSQRRIKMKEILKMAAFDCRLAGSSLFPSMAALLLISLGFTAFFSPNVSSFALLNVPLSLLPLQQADKKNSGRCTDIPPHPKQNRPETFPLIYKPQPVERDQNSLCLFPFCLAGYRLTA